MNLPSGLFIPSGRVMRRRFRWVVPKGLDITGTTCSVAVTSPPMAFFAAHMCALLGRVLRTSMREDKLFRKVDKL